MILKKYVIFVFLLSLNLLNAQQKITIMVEGENKAFPVSSFESNNLLYISAKNIAIAFNANYYFNKENEKLEIKFTNFNAKFTANNHFVIITDRRDDSKKVYQLPQSAKIVNDDIFLPIPYSIEYLEYASGRKIKYNESAGEFLVSKSGAVYKPTDTVEQEKEEEPVVTKNELVDITGVKVEEKSNGTLLRIICKNKVEKFTAKYSNDALIVEIGKSTVDPKLESEFEAVGIIRSLDVKKNGANNELVFEMHKGYTAHDSFRDPESHDLFVAIHNKKLTKIKKTESKDKWNFDVVVLDAGHGGKDAGAIGTNGVKEKDINLGIVLKLGKLLEQNLTSVKVVYTRKKDNFVELYKRGKIANENNGKLFISVHCNSTPKKPTDARGFEVYLLRPGRTQEAINIAEFENSVIKYEDNPNRYQKLTDENFILVSMAQSSYMRYSERFSDILNTNWRKEVSIPSRGIKQAGFYVLVGASMPNVLIEAGFLSNNKDEAFLKSESGQNEIAKAIFNSIKNYKEYYEQSMVEETN